MSRVRPVPHVSQLRLVVEAPDYDAAVAFYRDALGLPQRDAFEGPGGAHVMILDAGRATLELANPAQHRYIDEVEVGRPVAGPIRVAFEVDDAERATRALAEGGASVIAPPTRTPWDSLNARLDGPAGLQLTVFQERPFVEPALAPAYPIETERLLLRPIDPTGDVDAIHAYQSLPEVARYVPYEPRTREQVAERLAGRRYTRSTLDAAGQVLQLAIVLRETGALIGDALLMWHSAEHRSGEIGYELHPDHHGKGYATEAAQAMLALAFDGLGLHRVAARIDQRNQASARVLTKIGMRQEAVLVDNEWFKGEWSTEVDFAILEDEWASRRSRGL